MLTCPRCGSRAAPDAAGGLCPGCLLLAGSETFASASFDELPTITSLPDGPDVDLPDSPRLSPGQVWGAYRIGALLGRGGMGEVYEAEHTGSGRRVALKVLRGRLRPSDRARFLREGQLAASVSHPHTVYIFGSEEIAGMPVITMELLPGGTLKDRVAAEGPLPIEDAVAAVLDIVGGLDAAQASGILHRDIKPSNCFVEHDGTVKVGDFGLSISTLARDVHAGVGEGFEGTPQFAPPEQLRGEPLDLRADIYAVGATLYYLLTGHPPFEASDLRELVTRVTSEPAPSPRVHRSDVPQALAALVQQCLAKLPADRPASYAALAEALRPFAPGAHRPASPGIRFVAGAIDSAILSIPSAAVGAWAGVGGPGGAAHPGGYLLLIAIQFFYYLALEGFGSASLGKRLLGLRVLTSSGQPASPSRIVLRTLVFLSGPILGGAPMAYDFLPGGSTGFSVQAVPLIALVVLFTTMRRRNGWAGLHELASRTRVVAVRQAETARIRSASTADQWALAPQAGTRRGPFVLGPMLRESREGALRAGFDPQLRRPVWILDVAADASLAAARRDTARPTRLRWLTGKRTSDECWDAFEAPAGAPLLVGLDPPVAWPTLKSWLLDLSRELAAAERDGTIPTLAVDRLWLREDGRLVLLDFPAPGLDGAPPQRTPAGLIADVVRLARGADADPASAPPWPLAARRLFERLTSTSPPPLDALRDDLVRASASLDSVTRWRRVIPAMLAAAPAVVLGVAGLAILPALTAIGTPDAVTMLGWLGELRRAEGERRITDAADRLALERFVAGRYRAEITDDEFWSNPVARTAPVAQMREAGLEAITRHPDVTEAELVRLAEQLAPHMAAAEAASRTRVMEIRRVSGIVVVGLSAVALMFAFGCAVVSSLAVPGGILPRLLGLAVVGRDGAEIGRGRSAARALLGWSPVLVWFAYLAAAPRADGWVPMPAFPLASLALLFIVMAAALAWLLASPARGLHDRLLGTTVVSR